MYATPQSTIKIKQFENKYRECDEVIHLSNVDRNRIRERQFNSLLFQGDENVMRLK
jgi:hypothetical protein